MKKTSLIIYALAMISLAYAQTNTNVVVTAQPPTPSVTVHTITIPAASALATGIVAKLDSIAPAGQTAQSIYLRRNADGSWVGQIQFQ